jgi:hypothetical protein
VAALVGAAFIGGEAYILLGAETRELPIRKALRAIGDLIRRLEAGQPKR